MSEKRTPEKHKNSSNNQPPLMEAENLLNLFNSYWFEHEILKTQAHPLNTELNPASETLELSLMSIEELGSSSSISSFSPNSVLSRALQPIFSGKEMQQAVESEDLEQSRTRKKVTETETPKRNRGSSQGRKKLQRGLSKSLSDLEFEEIRGFMELGFVFSEEDKRSEFLATILPGLQKYGVETEKEEKGSGISRPYLSEAWEVSERKKTRRRKNPPSTMSWGELPSVSSEIDMKDYLKSWAHTVANSVK